MRAGSTVLLIRSWEIERAFSRLGMDVIESVCIIVSSDFQSSNPGASTAQAAPENLGVSRETLTALGRWQSLHGVPGTQHGQAAC